MFQSQARSWSWLRLAPGPLRQALRIGLYPTLMLGIPLAALPLFERFDPMAVGLATLFATIPLFFLLERMLPWSERWLGSHGDVHADVGLTLCAGFVTPLVEGATHFGALWILVMLAEIPLLGGVPALWPKDWPLLAQAALALVAVDFFRYWFHRALHQWPWLWRIHATHHSADRLYFYNGARIHPFEILTTGIFEGIPIVLMGITPEALAMRFVIGRVIGRFQHCNLDVRLGPLDWIFSTPRNHRWHHSRNLEEAAHNYGGDVILWDHLFGTFYLPSDREPSDEIGIGDMPEFPRRLDRVLLTPFTWNRYRLPGARPTGHA